MIITLLIEKLLVESTNLLGINNQTFISTIKKQERGKTKFI